jgi:CubicO group peptidase (beta-lactamase class C family)
MPTWHVPGGQLAVAWDDRLVLNRGYGLADVDRPEPVQPEALFRIASASKAITAVAILTLVDAGTLALDERAFPLLGLSPAANAATDPRLDTITVEQLLVHAGGWDSSQSFDPQYLPWCRMAAVALGLEDPPEPTTIVRYMLGVPLDFAPGSRSNMKPAAGGFEWSKPGALEGTAAALVFRGVDGLTFAFAFNALPDDYRGFVTEMGQAILGAAGAVESWPTHDLFA